MGQSFGALAIARRGQRDAAQSISRTGRNALDSAGPPVQSLVTKGADALNSTVPVYTVPRNATLIGSTGMTALVGRVPIQGRCATPCRSR